MSHSPDGEVVVGENSALNPKPCEETTFRLNICLPEPGEVACGKGNIEVRQICEASSVYARSAAVPTYSILLTWLNC